MATLQSLLLHSPLGILGTHAHTPGVSFKPPGPGREARSTTWESSDIAIMLTAGSLEFSFFKNVFKFFAIGHMYLMERNKERKLRNHPTAGGWPSVIPFLAGILGTHTHTLSVTFKSPGL